MQKDVVEGASNRELCRRVLYIDKRNAIELIVEEKAAARDLKSPTATCRISSIP